jgi:hypothetical protein
VGLVHEWLAESTRCSVADCEALFSDWRVVYKEEGGAPAAAALLHGTEAHFIVAPEWRGKLIRRDNARAFLEKLLQETGGLLTTRVLHGNQAPAYFIRRLGFIKTWSDGTFDFYVLGKLPFQRSAPT